MTIDNTITKIQVRTFPNKGRGIFAIKDIKEGEIIEIAPVLTFSEEESALIMETKLVNYCFSWGDGRNSAIALGFGSIYNHSDTPSAFYQKREHRDDMVFMALRDIKSGEEITVHYGEHWWEKRGENPVE